MHHEVFRAIDDGATVIAASRRLARALTQAFHADQRAQGRSVWKTPDILPLDAFLDRLWRDWVLSGSGDSAPVLLASLQEQMVWEQLIRESPAGESLLQIPETAAAAGDAWRLVHAYRLPVDGRFEASHDWSAFAAWSRAFQKLCQSNNWLERARLTDFLADLLSSGRIARPQQVYVAGFDEWTPQQSTFLGAIGQWRELEIPECAPQVERLKMRDAADEMRAAAVWARRKMEVNPLASIGIVVPGLNASRARVERIFRETLDPGAELDYRDRPFHVSLGPSLSQYPVVSAALLILEFAAGPLPLPQIGMLLRSPFLGGAEAEWTRRALLDVKLRRYGPWSIDVARLREEARDCPALQRLLHGLEQSIGDLPQQQRPSAWSRSFVRLLEAAHWPGDKPLSSSEYQVVEAWHGLLSQLAALDLSAASMTLAAALARLRKIAEQTTFQIENEGAPVQIMGMLEASGMRFDHLWVMGLHDDALPAPHNPNPFLPISLQRDRSMPHSSAERELEFANLLIGRLLASAPEVVFSYPEREGDRALAPSPVAGGPWVASSDAAQPNEWIARMRAGLDMETFEDETAPPLADPSMQQRGGTSLFKDMAACPFRAFAKHRLNAKPLDDADFGLGRRDQGSAVHKALERIWTELESQQRLLELSSDQLRDLVARSVEAAIQRLGPGIGRRLEQRRLEQLLGEWLEIEKSRTPFFVRCCEEKRTVTIGGLQVEIRADRIDELASGGEIILDYKSGKVKPGVWDSDRPDDPQIPLYCATIDRPIAGAALASIRTGELGFKGLAEPGAALPDMKAMKMSRPLPFNQQVEEWKRVLTRLAADYSNGVAAVDPKRDACELCGVQPLCRIRELNDDRR